jgi:predicted transcriptional regulator
MARAPKKLVPISIRLDEDIRDALLKLAGEQDRSLSYMLNLAAQKYVESLSRKKS